MRIDKDKEYSENELYKSYLLEDWEDIYSFPEFIERLKEKGVKVLKSTDE